MVSDARADTPAAPINLSIVSNSLLLREGLVRLLGEHLSLALIGSYPGDRSPELAPPAPPAHVVLLDSEIGSAALLEQTHAWRRLASYVIVLDLRGDTDAILACIEAGANGYTLRGSGVADLATTVCDVLRGQAHCSPEVTARLFAQLAARPPARPTDRAGLTGRELEVLDLVARSYTNKQIAEALFIEVRTVKHHVHSILEKFQLRYRWEAARHATQHGLLPLSPGD